MEKKRLNNRLLGVFFIFLLLICWIGSMWYNYYLNQWPAADSEKQKIDSIFTVLEINESNRSFYEVFSFVFGLAVIGLGGYLCYQRFDFRARQNRINEALTNIPRCPDERLWEYARQLGIEIDSRKIEIPGWLMEQAAPQALARLVIALIYSRYDRFSREMSFDYNVFHSLADCLLDYWAYDEINDFVGVILAGKEYLGRRLQQAIFRRQLERKIGMIQDDLAEIKEREVAENAENLSAVTVVENQLALLTSGGEV